MIVKAFLVACLTLAISIISIEAKVTNHFDNQDRLYSIEYDDGSYIEYTYDSVGNQISINSSGNELEPPEVEDSGLYNLDNTQLDLVITTYGQEYGNLTYKYIIGTSPCGDFVIDWTPFVPFQDGTALIEDLALPWGQEYFICVRILNFAGDIVSASASTDGIYVLEPSGDQDGDDATNQEEIDVGSNPLDPNSYPHQTIIELKPGFNLASIPTDYIITPDLEDWLPVFGDATEIREVLVYDVLGKNFLSFFHESTTNPDYMLNGTEGLIVYSDVEKTVTFETVLCSSIDLLPGFNSVGFACPPEGYSAFELLEALGSDNASSIQRYNTETGTLVSASFKEDGQVAGIDFTIVPGEGYFVFMKEEVLGVEF